MKTFIVSAVIAALAASAEVDCDEYDYSTDTESYIHYCLDFAYETACLYICEFGICTDEVSNLEAVQCCFKAWYIAENFRMTSREDTKSLDADTRIMSAVENYSSREIFDSVTSLRSNNGLLHGETFESSDMIRGEQKPLNDGTGLILGIVASLAALIALAFLI